MEQLIKLQGIDSKLKDLNDLLGDLPTRVEGLNKKEEMTKNTISDKKSRLKEIDVDVICFQEIKANKDQFDDDLSKTINYADLQNIVHDVVVNSTPIRLMETMMSMMIDKIKELIK